MSPLEQIKGTDIGLEIITKSSEGWPKEQFNLRALTKGMLQGKYKWICTNKNYSEEVFRLSINNDIELKDYWRIVEDQKFKKIRNGFCQDRTPSSNRERFRKISK